MLLKFASVSLISFALDYGLFLLLSTATQQFCLCLLCSNVAARLGSGFFNYQLNRTLVFHSQENQRQNLGGIPFAGDRDSPGQQRDPSRCLPMACPFRCGWPNC